MKNLLLTLRSALLLLLLVGTVPIASAFYYRGVQYEITGDGTVGVSSSYGYYSGDITIPAVVYADVQNYGEEYSLSYVVTSVIDNAFYNASQLTSIVLPNTIKSIGDNAFYGCTSLSSVTLSNGIVSIGESAFSGCTALKSITLPNTVHSLGWNVFYGCTSLTQVTLPDYIYELNGTFSGCTSLTSLNIPSAAVTLDGTFKGCSSLKSVVIPNSVNTIGDNTFQDCSALTHVYIANSVSMIGNMAFSNTGLTELSLPSTLTNIGENAFQGCNQLSTITTRPVTPPSMSKSNTFSEWIYNNAKLTVPQVALSSYQSKDWWNLFKNVTGNQSLNNSYDFVVNGIYYNKLDDSTVEVTYKDSGYNSYSGSVTIPATISSAGKTYNVTRIGYNAFYHCTGLTGISLPSSVTVIAAGAFNGCSGLSSLTIPQSIKSIGSAAFDGCTGLTQLVWNAKSCLSNGDMTTSNINKVTIGSNVEVLPAGFVANSQISSVNIPSSVTVIAGDAFYGCASLSSLTIPLGITSIGDNAFAECSGLTSLTWNARNCWSNGNMSTGNMTQVSIGNQVESLPAGFISQSRVSKVTLPSSIKYIDSKAFYECSALSEINLPSGLEAIGEKAFYGCSSIKNLTIPRSVSSIGEYAFNGCDGITNLTWNAIRCGSNGDMSTSNISQVTIGNEVKRLPARFVSDSKITTVNIPNSVDSIFVEAFSGCSRLASVNIPNSVVFMYSSAFYNCENLTSVHLSSSLETIYSETFSGCSSLAEVVIPESVYEIDYHAFAGCSGLERLTIGSGVGYIADEAFAGCSSLSSIVVNSDNQTYDSRDNCNAIISSSSNSLRLGCKSTVIPTSVTSIGRSAFLGCTGLTSIQIPSTITYIGSDAFQDCTGLTRVEAQSLESWCNISFDRLNSNPLYYAHHLYLNGQELTELDIPNSIKTIKAYSFAGLTGLTSITIPAHVTSIGSGAFSDTGLTTVYYNAENCSSSGYGGLFPTTLQEIVIGGNVKQIPNYFVSGCTGLANVTIPDGVTSIGNSAFSGCSSLMNVSIGSSVKTIGAYAFSGCSSLQSVICRPLTPPSINSYSTFYGVPSSMTVYVLPDALDTYKSNYNWNQYNIELLKTGTKLTVNLPAGADVAKFVNMDLVVTSATSDKTLHYVLTDRQSYSFNVDNNSRWNVVLSNQYGDELGKINDVAVGENDVAVTFATLKTPQTVTLKVLTPSGQDVTGQARVSWKDDKGNLLVQGNEISGLPAGRKLTYGITLPQELATAYGLPADMTYTVKDGDNTAVCQLAVIAQTKLSGKVKEAVTNQPIYGASISATQSFAGGNTKTVTATTNNQGTYALDVLSVPTRLTVAAQGYISQTVDCDEVMNGGNNITVPDVVLNPITGAVINVNLTYTPAHVVDASAETQNWYNDYQNVDYEVFNKTTGHAITDISVQYPQIVLIEDVNDGDVLELTATSRKDAFNPVKTTVTIAEQKANATFNIVERGKVSASFNENENSAVVGMLYDNDRKLVRSAEYSGNSLTMDDVKDGSYRLISMGKSDLFNTIYDLQEFTSIGLQNNVDYISKKITVSEGVITNVSIDKVPFLDESKLYYTGENTSFTVNKPSIVVGNYLTFRAQVDFKEEFIGRISDVQLIIDLPESCSVYENSVLVGTSTGTYTITGNKITIPLANLDEVVRFCAIPTEIGDFTPSAFVKFKLKGKNYVTQPIGAARFTAKGLSINVPSKAAQTRIPITGTAIGACTVAIYDNDVLIGQTTSLANGMWSTSCELKEPYNHSTHILYAKVTTQQGLELKTETKICTYDETVIEVSKVVMYHHNPELGKTYELTFDFLNPSNAEEFYTYYIYNKKFSFTIEFTSNDPNKISDVVLYVQTAKSGWWPLEAHFDMNKVLWVAEGEFGNMYDGDLPINVAVDFVNKTSSILSSEVYDTSINLYENDQEDVYDEIDAFDARLDSLFLEWDKDDFNIESIRTMREQLYSEIGITPSNNPPKEYSQEELESLLAESEYLLNDSISAFKNNFLKQSLVQINELMEGISITTCTGLSADQLLSNGFQKVEKDDNTFIYIFVSDTEYKCADFINDIYYEIDLESAFLGPALISLRDDSDFETRMREYSSKLQSGFDKVRSLMGQFADLIDGLENKLLYRANDLAEEFIQLDDIFKYYESKPSMNWAEHILYKQYKARWRALCIETKFNNTILRWLDKLDAPSIRAGKLSAKGFKVGRVGGGAFAAFDLFMVCRDMMEDVENVISAYNMIPKPCENDQDRANSLRNVVVGMGIGAGIYYAAQIVSDAAQITLAITGTAAALPTGGTSMSAVGIAVGLAVTNVAAALVYEANFDKSLAGVVSQIESLDCFQPDSLPPFSDPKGYMYNGSKKKFTIDPSGFVYEGVPSNRLQGVTATCYYKETVEDMYGDEHEEVVLWDASQYGQENPLLTDENGYYRWDVPVGMWQVKYEKAGYETTYSDWLPVPPPQLDVNIGMVQMRQPEVIKARAYPQAVELEFDKFMFPETLTSENITVSVNGNAVNGSIELLNAEVDDPLAITSIRRAPGTGLTFASRVRFNAGSPFNADHVTLHVKQDVESYAGLQMNEDYEVTLPIEYEMEKIVADTTLNVLYGGSRTLTVTVEPAMASRGKTLSVRTASPMIVSTDAESYTLDNNGQAIITVNGDLPGAGSLLYGVDGYDLSAATLVSVKMESELTVAVPTASIASGSMVEKGTAVYLNCSTPGATIYYTLDGSCPCDPTPARKVYNGEPIIIEGNVTIKAMATAPDLFDSDVATFVYRVPMELKGDVNNDSEVNIADINALIDIILGGDTDAETRARADVNNDSEVNIADINALIDIILGSGNSKRFKVNCDDLLHLGSITLKPGDIATLQVTASHASRYSAMQCDIVLPAGLSLLDVNGMGGHESKSGSIDELTTRAMTYSMNKRHFAGDGMPVMTITVRADAALASESEIKLTNIVLSDDDNKAWHLADCTTTVNNATGVNDLTADGATRVWVDGRSLCISTHQDGVARVVTVNGIVSEMNIKAGENRHELEPGIYVVIVNSHSYKIAIK